MGRGISEVALVDLPDVIGRYSNVQFFNDPSDTDLLKTVEGSPRTILINLGQLLNISSGEVQGDAIAIDEIEATEIAAGAVDTSELAAGALAADAAGRAKVATDFFDETTVDDLFASGAIDGSDRLKTASVGDDRMTSSIVKEPGRIAMGLVDFNATGDCTSVDVGATAVYTRHDTTQDSPNGVWEDGVDGSASATNLAAAINGDTRNGGAGYYAAVAQGTTCWIFALAVGTAGNVTITRTGGANPDVTENLISGAAAAVKQAVHIQHTVTSEEATQVEVHLPLPFDVAFFEWHVYDTNGGILVTEVTDRATVTAASSPVPAFFRIVTNGATHISAGDIIRITCVE